MKKPLLLAAALGATVADWQPAQLPQAAETTVTSAHSGRSYRIQTATIGEAPPAGYPVLYLLDGDTYFPYALPLAQTLLNPPGAGEKRALALVGIGYPGGKMLDLAQRTRETTPRRWPVMTATAATPKPSPAFSTKNCHRCSPRASPSTAANKACSATPTAAFSPSTTSTPAAPYAAITSPARPSGGKTAALTPSPTATTLRRTASPSASARAAANRPPPATKNAAVARW